MKKSETKNTIKESEIRNIIKECVRLTIEEAKNKNWIKKSVNPDHKGYCTPMSKSTCTPKRKALAKRFKSGDLKENQGGTSGDFDYKSANNKMRHMEENGLTSEVEDSPENSEFGAESGAPGEASGNPVNIEEVIGEVVKILANSESLTPEKAIGTLEIIKKILTALVPPTEDEVPTSGQSPESSDAEPSEPISPDGTPENGSDEDEVNEGGPMYKVVSPNQTDVSSEDKAREMQYDPKVNETAYKVEGPSYRTSNDGTQDPKQRDNPKNR